MISGATFRVNTPADFPQYVYDKFLVLMEQVAQFAERQLRLKAQEIIRTNEPYPAIAHKDMYDSLDVPGIVERAATGVLAVVTANVPYAGYRASGSPPIPLHWAPPDRIRWWIEAKGIAPMPTGFRKKPPTLEQLTFLVGRKLAERGWIALPFFDLAMEAIRGEVEQEIRNKLEQLSTLNE